MSSSKVYCSSSIWRWEYFRSEEWCLPWSYIVTSLFTPHHRHAHTHSTTIHSRVPSIHASTVSSVHSSAIAAHHGTVTHSPLAFDVDGDQNNHQQTDQKQFVQHVFVVRTKWTRSHFISIITTPITIISDAHFTTNQMRINFNNMFLLFAKHSLRVSK